MRHMAKLSTVLGCCLMLLLAAGCGGGGAKSNSASTSTGVSVNRSQACAFADEANITYQHDAVAQGLNFKDKAGETKLIAAIGQFRERIQTLSRATSAVEAAQLASFAAALTQQEDVFVAIRANDFKTADTHAQGLNEALEAGRKNFAKICAG